MDGLKTHLNKEHYQCDLCRSKLPHIYYKNYDELAEHFDASHFRCKEPRCLETNPFLVYETEAELSLHTDKVHIRAVKPKKGKTRFNITGLLGIKLDDPEDEAREEEQEPDFFDSIDYPSFMLMMENMRESGYEVDGEMAEQMFNEIRKNQDQKQFEKVHRMAEKMDHIGQDFSRAVGAG